LHAERGKRKSTDLIQAILTRQLFGEACLDLWCGWSKGDNQLPSLELPGKCLSLFANSFL